MTNGESLSSPAQVTLTGDVLSLHGAMTLTHARRLADAGAAMLSGGTVTVDLQAASEIDSSALAVLFSWQRTQRQQGGSLSVRAAPESLQTLARVYGVDDQLVWA